MSIATRPVLAPYSAPRRTSEATFALWISFLLGRQLTLGQEPPTHRRSTTAVRRPARAMCQASSLPPAPLPRTTISNRSACAIALCPYDGVGPRSVTAHGDARTRRLREGLTARKIR